MTYSEASAFVWPWGKYKGQTLDQIASTDAGLRYLDYMRGEREKSPGGPVNPASDRVLAALTAYLDDPSIKRELENLR